MSSTEKDLNDSSVESDDNAIENVEIIKEHESLKNKDGSNESSDENEEKTENKSNGEEIISVNIKTFKELGLNDVLCKACEKLNWPEPTSIQKEAIPLALSGCDIIGLAETGSGKTGAFALPILHELIQNPQRYFALILTPTRELAFQISEQFEALGSAIGVKSAVIVGGMDMSTQAMVLQKKPHILIATPGRLVDHLENTKGFSLKSLKYLVMDEADRILNTMDFGKQVDKILKVVPNSKERKTYLFSATMTKKVEKLKRASLRNPITVEVSNKHKTVDQLQQYYILIPAELKDTYLVHLMKEVSGSSFLVFCATCARTMKIALMLRTLGISAIPLNGQMSQNKRLSALTKFRAKSVTALISTDVASRGLDIPHVDVVFNYDMPTQNKDYIHRVGRTARAGRSGISITFTSQYNILLFLSIEEFIGKKLPLYETDKEEVMTLKENVEEATRAAELKIKDMSDIKGRKRKRIDDVQGIENDTETLLGLRKKMYGKKNNKNKKFNKKSGSKRRK